MNHLLLCVSEGSEQQMAVNNIKKLKGRVVQLTSLTVPCAGFCHYEALIGGAVVHSF